MMTHGPSSLQAALEALRAHSASNEESSLPEVPPGRAQGSGGIRGIVLARLFLP
jgi:hypothetical protein